MNHTILEVLSAWLIVLTIDLFVAYQFVKLANRSKL